MICGLLGERLSHSYSPQIHSQFGAYCYELFEKKPTELADFLQNGQYHGINVTMPYKKAVIPYCSKLSREAEMLGAVNTIVRQPDGSLLGHNTDYYGFRSMLDHAGIDLRNKKVVVLGTGGASATVCAVLKEIGSTVIVVSRSGENNYDNLYLHADCSAIVNATPVGMYPNTDASPVVLDRFPNLEGVLDLIYNPARTMLLMDAEDRGLKTENGLWMLVAQARQSAEWFTGNDFPDSIIGQIHSCLRKQMENIVLIGMPGCGKTTNGKNLARILGKSFVDIDEHIVREAGCSIPEIFESQGENAFREFETRALASICKESGLVIATGGGCVTRPENRRCIRQNGSVIWLKRPTEQLSKFGRPLSQKTDLNQMLALREPNYRLFSDYSIECGLSASITTDKIIALLDQEVFQ